MQDTATHDNLLAHCNGDNLEDKSVCCAGEAVPCPNKPCFDYFPDIGTNLPVGQKLSF